MSDQSPTDKPGQGIGTAILLMMAAISMLPVMNVIAKFLSETYPTTQVVWARYAGHVVFVLLVFWPRHGKALFRAHRPGIHILRSLLMYVATCFFFLALRYIEVPVASSINFTSPLLVTALAVPFLGEKVGWRRWLAVLAGFIGALIIIRPGTDNAHWAMILVLGTSLCYATYQILTRRFATADSPETSVFYIALIGTIVGTGSLLLGAKVPESWVDAAMFAGLGVIGGLGHYLIIRALRLGEASVLSPLNYGQLVMATLVSFLVFGTFPDLWTWIGAAIIISSGIYITYRETRRRPA
jgi:drug/metabolite transporter (DMT)-like permease